MHVGMCEVRNSFSILLQHKLGPQVTHHLYRTCPSCCQLDTRAVNKEEISVAGLPRSDRPLNVSGKLSRFPDQCMRVQANVPSLGSQSWAEHELVGKAASSLPAWLVSDPACTSTEASLQDELQYVSLRKLFFPKLFLEIVFITATESKLEHSCCSWFHACLKDGQPSREPNLVKPT